MNEHVRAAGQPPVGSYRNIPYFALRGIFHEHGYHDREVAEAVGISEGAFSMKMRGHSHWRGDQIAAICELMDIPQKDIGRLFFPQVNGGRNKQ